MSGDYISRAAVLDEAKKVPLRDRNYRTYGNVVRSIPAADVKPVVRGKWIKPTRVPDSMLDECSVCGFDTGAYTFNYCPSCGAKMDGGKEE